MPFPFEVTFQELQTNLDSYVDIVFASLQSEFLSMPKGPGFVEYPVFEQGYEALKKVTRNFRDMTPGPVIETVYQQPVALIVLRTMLGFSPPEWAYAASQRTGVEVPQGVARAIDGKIRRALDTPLKNNGGVTDQRIHALVETACALLTEGAPAVPEDMIHRLDKADTKSGLASLQSLADLGVPYAMLLYERLLGSPFVSHRNSVSELIGDVLESAIQRELDRHGVSCRPTRRAERIPGFDQAPDFIVPSEFNPQLVIEAKITEDDGTARDKVTRILHLVGSSVKGRSPDQPCYEVVACIDGRGFAVRREDMRKLLLATRGKVFTLQNLDKLVEHTKAREFKSR